MQPGSILVRPSTWGITILDCSINAICQNHLEGFSCLFFQYCISNGPKQRCCFHVKLILDILFLLLRIINKMKDCGYTVFCISPHSLHALDFFGCQVERVTREHIRICGFCAAASTFEDALYSVTPHCFCWYWASVDWCCSKWPSSLSVTPYIMCVQTDVEGNCSLTGAQKSR